MIIRLLSFTLAVSLILDVAACSVPVRASEEPPRSSPASDVPSWFPKAAPLPSPQGEVIHAATVDELYAAVDRVGPGGTIVLADGRYRLPRTVVLHAKKGITIRSAAGDPARVVLSGGGWDSDARGEDLLHVGRCEGVTLAGLTFADCRSYGIKVEAENAPKDVHIYNCRFRDIGVRAIKGSAGQDPNVRAVKGSVRYCHFENTKIPPAGWLYGGDYIAAIDMMALDGWTFSGNIFRNIKGRNGGGRAAIFIWVRSQRVVVERNLIVNCDRGVAFGNPGQSTANRAGERLVYVRDGIIRNNFIAGGSDCGIELWYADDVKVFNNTIWRPERNWSRGIRVGTGTTRAEIANNMVHGEIRCEGGEANLRSNLAGRLDSCFTDPASGDLTLTPAAAGAVDRGTSLPEISDDIRGRPRRGPIDIGAWESNGIRHPTPVSVSGPQTGETLQAGATVSLGMGTATIKRIDAPPYVEHEFTRRFRFDSFGNPKLRELRERYQLDAVIAPGKDEFERQVLLLDWGHHRFKKFGRPSSAARGALEILQAIDEGHAFLCSHYAPVFVSAAASLGWVHRELALRRHQRTVPVDPAVDPYFPINQAALSLVPEQDQLQVTLQTLTPNFRAYEMRQDRQPVWGRGSDFDSRGRAARLTNPSVQ